jgi:hypothetical protein
MGDDDDDNMNDDYDDNYAKTVFDLLDCNS